MKKKYFQILWTIFLAILSVFFLRWSIARSTKNGFNRIHTDNAIQIKRIISLKSIYGKILIGKDSNIVLLDGSFRTIIFIDTNGNIINKVLPSEIFLNARIDHINDVIIEQNQNIIFCGNSGHVFFCTEFSENSFAKKEQLNFNYSHAVIINRSDIIFRKTDSSKKNCVFVKYNLDNHKVIDSNYLYPKINDGGLSTDGLLLFNQIDRLFYVNYYNSEITQFDTALTLLKKISTIDETKKLPTVFFNSQKKAYKFSTPNVIVNNIACVNSQYLIVNSLKRADNENFTRFKDNYIDVYTANNGLYKFSFHISSKYGAEVIDMKLFENNVMVVLTNESLVFLKIKK